MLDCLFIGPPSDSRHYQGLAEKYTAIEPPTWALLLAESCRSIGHKVGIFDIPAEEYRIKTLTGSDESAQQALINRIAKDQPRYICFVVYGQNPNSGTMMMGGALDYAEYIKKHFPSLSIIFVGSHVSALPLDVLAYPQVDLVLMGEGVYSLRSLLSGDDLRTIPGVGFKSPSKLRKINPGGKIVPQDRMDIDLPGYAWDLLPYHEKPLDLYRSHFWHAEYDHDKRTPFAAIYTSLGCMFKCEFCMINMVNRTDFDITNPIGQAPNHKGMRFWSPEFIIKEFDKLWDLGVRTLRISDEMFLLNKKYYKPLCELIRDRGYGKDLNMWAYSRIDTVADIETLKLVRDAGIRMLALGIESGDKKVRLEVTKGKFEEVDIHDVIQRCRDADIEPTCNYIFGLPGDTHETMLKTLELGLELNSVYWNGYTAMPLPGSVLYKKCIDNGWKMPESFEEWSFYSYETLPMPTDNLTPEEILAFRDWAWQVYHTNPRFLSMIEEKYGKIAKENIQEMAKIQLKRKILGD